ncbi:hypothetical protein [Clostridium sp.]|uniref:hypothetical protein n=1 Tax=Clostridium sp. TaxID=1506 RepID=UPI002606501F|nr:hypothetical protein [Clostridium sp.]
MLPFIIILIGIILIVVNLKLINKKEKLEESFGNILKREELNENKDYGLEIISIRKDLAETVMDLQKEIDELRNYIKTLKNKEETIDNNIEDKYGINNFGNSYLNHEEDVISEIKFSRIIGDNENIENEKKLDKTQRVKSLLEKGLSEEEICEELSIGRGEVLLIKNLLKK